MKNTVATEVIKGYCSSDISRNIKDIKWTANKKALKDIGGVQLNLKKIYNISTLWKYQNPDIPITKARIQ